METVFIVVIAVILVLALHFYWFEFLPRQIVGDGLGSPEICQRLERIAAVPSLLGQRRKVHVHHDLLRLLNHWGQPERALHHGEKLLSCNLDPTLESEVRIRMADALESLGRRQEAEDQRRRARAGRAGEIEVRDASWFINQGRTLEAERDYPGACEAFAQALAIMPPGNDGPRVFALLHLSLAEFQAGRIRESADHAVKGAELATDPLHLHTARRQASVAYATLGEIDASERYDRLVRDAARGRGETRAEAEASAHLAENLRKRGRLREAFEAIDEAGRIQDVREVRTVRYEILRSAGRYAEALDELDAACRIGQFGLGRHERKMQALYDLGASRLLLELGRVDEAAVRHDRAANLLADDPKLRLWCLAAGARLEAVRGSRESARDLMARAESGLAAFASDRNTLQVVYGNLGRAALAMGDFERALRFWNGFMELRPTPVDEPIGHFHLGECHRGRGDLESARDSYRKAVATGLETPEVERAARRLGELAA